MGTYFYMTVLLALTIASSRTEDVEGPPTIIDFPKQDKDNKGSVERSFRIPCNAAGGNIEFTWRQFKLEDNTALIREYDKSSKGDTTVDDNGAIIGERVFSAWHNGYYQCFAKNTKGTTFSRKLRLRISSVSDFVKKDEENIGSKEIGDIVMLTCPPLKQPQTRYGGSFGYVVSWGKSDGKNFHTIGSGKNILHSPGKLTFSPLMQDNCKFLEGIQESIICKVEAANSFYASSGYSLTCSKSPVDPEKKKKSPEWVQSPEDTTVAVEGNEANLVCAASGVPTPDVVWYFNNKIKITTGTNGYELPKFDFNRRLKIKTVIKAKHEGKYTCKVNNTEGELKLETVLKVQVRPKLKDNVPKRLIIPMYGNGSLKCEASGVPPPSYYWWNNGQELFKLRGKMSLELVRLNLSDSGVYQCVAENIAGMVVTATEVKVIVKAPTFKKFGPFPLFKKTAGRLLCKTEAIPTADQFVWFHNGVELKTNTLNGRYFLSSDGTLLIKDVEPADEGNYRCSASNEFGNGSAEANSTIYDQTLMEIQPTDTSVQEGGDFHLPCKASHDKRLQVKYRWLKDGAEITNTENLLISQEGDISKLLVKKAQMNDAGVYACVAFTPLPAWSEVRATAVVKIKVPSAPVDVNIIPFGKYILLRWGAPNQAYGVIKGYSVGIVSYDNHQPGNTNPKLEIKLKANRFEHLFTNLQYTTNYTVGVAGENGAGIGEAVYLITSTVQKQEPAKPGVPLVQGVSTTSVNVTFEYGLGGGYPAEFMVKYRETVNSSTKGDTTTRQVAEYQESEWWNTTADRWIEIKGLSNSLYEFRTVGNNELGYGLLSDPSFGRPLRSLPQKETPFYTTAWFIVLIVLVVLILAALPLVMVVRKQHEAKYFVEKRETKNGIVMDAYAWEEDAHFDNRHDVEDQRPRYSRTSTNKSDVKDESDNDSLEGYGEGQRFSEDGSFIGEYGDRDNDPIVQTFV